MIHADAPHFLWPFVVWYAAHELNLWPRVSLPETSPTLRWTGKVDDASVFRLFYHPTSCRVFPSRDVTFDEPVHIYRLFPYRSTPPPPPPLFLAPGPPPVDPLSPEGPAPSGAASGGAESGGADPGGAEPGGAESEGAGSGVAEPKGAEPSGVELGGTTSWGAEPSGTASSGGPAGVPPRLSPRPEPLSPQQLREWFAQRTRLWSGATRAGDSAAGDTVAGGAGVTTGAGSTGGSTAAGPRGASTKGSGAAGAGGIGGAGAGDPTEPGAAGAGAGAVDPSAGGAGAGGAGASQPPLQPASPLPAPSPYTEQTGGLTQRREHASRPASPVRTGRCVPRLRPPPVPGTDAMALRPSSVPLRVSLPPPPESSLPENPDPEFDRASAPSPTFSHLLATVVIDPSFESTAVSALVAELIDFATACRLDYATSLVAKSESADPPSVGGECVLGTDVLEDRQEDFECLAAGVPRSASMLLAPEGDPDAPDILTPRSYVEAIMGLYSFQWQAAMDGEMASWKSTGTYLDVVPPSRANIVDGMWIFRVKRPPGSPPAFKARYVARGFSQRQGVDYFQTFSPTLKMSTLRVLLHVDAQHDYELHSLDFSTAFLQGSLHEEIYLWRPVYGLCQAPREWHDTLRTTLAALGFAPSIADPSLFLRTDTSLAPFYFLVYVDNLVFATADTEALTLVKSELQKRHTCTDLGELRSYLGLQITRDRARRTITLTQSHMVHQVLHLFGFQYSSPQPTRLSTEHPLSAPPSDESVEPSRSYPELVGCFMYLMTSTRSDLAYPLSLLARYVAPGMGLVLGGRGPVVLTGHADVSWVDDSVTQRSYCEVEMYAWAMVTQELRWLTYLLIDLGEQPRSPPVLYVDNKVIIALCQEHRLEHRTKHIALRYFLARELQQRGQLRLAYVATRANTADIFIKALSPGVHQRFSTMLGLLALLFLNGVL
ncbi:unnamed protein product [Closterium sp. NIES-53]